MLRTRNGTLPQRRLRRNDSSFVTPEIVGLIGDGEQSSV